MDDADDYLAVLQAMTRLHLDFPGDSSEGVTTHRDDADAPAQPAAAETGHVKQPAGEWAEVLVSEMASATSMDDARCRAARILEAFGGAVCARAARVVRDKDRELENVRRQNTILKKAVVIQHRQHNENEEKGRELQVQVAQYREQVRRLEADNYGLSMHLRNAGRGASMPGNFHPEVF
ncbi:hypothetical protein CFC21_074591 [Triticum aestivum]|uniref:Uncharacterized protein n=2 Tax=Triticum aestivum TaxID=4565 RepID=A0A3B6LWV7_WHEAT|nr:hypothetical protein CFC21_074591 [Triticum aestivum]